MPFISIIIPIYNTATFLPRCIDSILSQSFADFELILVDDGSKDDSKTICDQYAEKDSRIHAFYKENGGVSSARNLGLDNASGDWVYFVDSDDEVISGGLQTMVDCISDDIDIVLAGYERYREDGSLFYKVDDRVVVSLEKTKSLSTLYKTHGLFYNYLSLCCLRLLRNEIIQREHLRFDSDLSNKEDTLFMTQYILCSNGITRFTTTPVYRYYERHNSAMGVWKRGFDYSFIDSLFALIKMKHEIAKHYPIYSDIVFIAQEGIWIRYNEILYRMKKMDIRDEKLQNTMKEVVNSELGLLFFIRKKIRNTRHIWGNSTKEKH